MSQRLALYLLGPPKLVLDDAPVSIDRRKTLALLAYLAIHPEQHTREYLSALFWPEYEQEKAFTNLRHTLWETQKAIGEGWISASRDKVGINPKHVEERNLWLDVSHFDTLIIESRSQTDIALRISLLVDSVKLYRNHFLTGFNLKDSHTFNEWSFTKSEQLHHQFAYALTTLSNDLCSTNQAETAISYTQRLVALDPLNETSHRQLMHVYLQAGQPNSAVKQYQTCEKILRKELGVDPQPETRSLYKQIRRGELKPTPPVAEKGTSTPRHNLPFQLSKFIGREQELNEITNLIADHRLVTLVGTGGIGKTRLSLKAGEQILSKYPDGVWFVELASLNDPARVPQVVATLFGITEDSDQPLTEKLNLNLRSKNLLLILDNCEHLIDACAQLADELLKHCPELKILATSREALNNKGEAVYHPPSFALPDIQQLLEHLLEFEAIQLFEERARLVQPKFSLTMENAAFVAQICRRLDGIPLAIELAAARVNILSTEQIAERLNESFDLLTSGSRTTLPRHKTIHASIAWSWNMLSGHEQILLQRLSVFSGGWSLAGAEALGIGIGEATVFDMLTKLVEKSLVSFAIDNERYYMLETVREYAMERLQEANEEELARSRHLDFYAALAEQAEPNLLGKQQGLWMKRLSEEQENIISANHWHQHSKTSTEQIFRLLGNTRYYWLYAGMPKLGFKMYSQALENNTGYENTLAVGLTHDGAAIYAMHLSSPVMIIEHVEKSIHIFQAYGDNVRLAMAFTRKAWGQFLLGNQAETIRFYQEAIAIGRLIEDKRPLSAALNNLAAIYGQNQDYEKAIALHEEAWIVDREREDPTGVLLGLAGMAKNKLMLGDSDYQQIRSLLAESAQIADETHLREYMQYSLNKRQL